MQQIGPGALRAILKKLERLMAFRVLLSGVLRPDQFLQERIVIRIEQSSLAVQSRSGLWLALQQCDLALQLPKRGVVFEIGQLWFDQLLGLLELAECDQRFGGRQ